MGGPALITVESDCAMSVCTFNLWQALCKDPITSLESVGVNGNRLKAGIYRTKCLECLEHFSPKSWYTEHVPRHIKEIQHTQQHLAVRPVRFLYFREHIIVFMMEF